jgi:hypothetical protein
MIAKRVAFPTVSSRSKMFFLITKVFLASIKSEWCGRVTKVQGGLLQNKKQF